MALGNAGSYNNNSNGNNKGLFEKTYYSRVRFKNPDSKLQLGFQYQKGMLVVDISKPKNENGFEMESVMNFYITHTKSMLLLDRIQEFEQYIKEGGKNPDVGFGINAGMGDTVKVLLLHVTETGNKAVLLAKVDQSGNFIEKVDFVFPTNYDYALKYNSINDRKVEKEYNDTVEWQEFVHTVEDFSRASNGAVGYSTIDMYRFDTQRILNKMNPIYEKLGIELRGGYNGNRSSNNNFFSNMGGEGNQGSSHHTTIDEVMDDGFPDEDE